MHDLRLVGVHDDGEHLVLTGTDGQRFRLRIDETLRAAVRRDRARLGQLQIEIDGRLRPRDIQARIRAGQTAEEVAEAAGLPLEHVRRYEGPVLAEREHVAGLARRLPARQVKHRPVFGDLVAERLTARGVDVERTSWDAWRREGSTWTVQLAFRAGSKDRVAQWAYDVQRSHLDPLDDEARWLSAPTAADDGPLPGVRRLAAVERVYDVEADGGVREADESATAPAAVVEAAPQEAESGARTLDLLDALRDRRGRRQPLLLEDDDLPGADDAPEPMPPAAHPPASRPQEAVDAEVLALPETPAEPGTADQPAGEVPTDAAPRDDEETGAAPEDAAPGPGEPRAPRTRRSKRAAVPSWDEIVFGAKRE
ncbi:MAG: septation protein SepH [Actinomycetes bacterium]